QLGAEVAQPFDVRSIKRRAASGKDQIAPQGCTSLQSQLRKSLQPRRPFTTQAPIDASPETRRGVRGTGINHIMAKAQLSTGRSEIASHMSGLGKAHN